MKQIKTVAVTLILTLLTFGSIVYTSCRKDYCKNMVCQNGGTCNDGACICPQGYTGTYCETPNVSSIAFRNKTFTKVFITVNNQEYSVDTGKTVTFTGSHGDTLKGKGRTRGAYGLEITIPEFKIVFPIRGVITHDLDVSSDYFFLMATNKLPWLDYITQVHVNYKQPDSTLDITVIENTSQPYYIGYYKATDSTKVRLEKTPSFWSFNMLNLPKTKNQFYNAIAM